MYGSLWVLRNPEYESFQSTNMVPVVIKVQRQDLLFGLEPVVPACCFSLLFKTCCLNLLYRPDVWFPVGA